MSDSLRRLQDAHDRKVTRSGWLERLDRRPAGHRVCSNCWHVVLAHKLDPATIVCPNCGGKLHEVEG